LKVQCLQVAHPNDARDVFFGDAVLRMLELVQKHVEQRLLLFRDGMLPAVFLVLLDHVPAEHIHSGSELAEARVQSLRVEPVGYEAPGTYVAFPVCLRGKVAEIPCVSNVRISSSPCSGPPRFGAALVSAKADTDKADTDLLEWDSPKNLTWFSGAQDTIK
jgi:hypothetical protein